MRRVLRKTVRRSCEVRRGIRRVSQCLGMSPWCAAEPPIPGQARQAHAAPCRSGPLLTSRCPKSYAAAPRLLRLIAPVLGRARVAALGWNSRAAEEFVQWPAYCSLFSVATIGFLCASPSKDVLGAFPPEGILGGFPPIFKLGGFPPSSGPAPADHYIASSLPAKPQSVRTYCRKGFSIPMPQGPDL